MNNNKEKKTQTARALSWSSAILIILGIVVISPAGKLLFQILAALFALIAIPLGRGSTRIMAIVLTIASLTMAYVSYPAYEKHMDIYMQKARPSSLETDLN